MDIATFLTLPLIERFELTQKEITGSTPFFLERLATALDKHSPICLMIFPQLKDEYWTLLEYKKSNQVSTNKLQSYEPY